VGKMARAYGSVTILARFNIGHHFDSLVQVGAYSCASASQGAQSESIALQFP
jgi:hypothetical protein